MRIILLEKVENLGGIGDIAEVRDGYARNYLLPYAKAKPATPDNIKEVEARRAELLLEAKTLQEAAEGKREKVDGMNIALEARTSDGVKLFGSIGVAEIAAAVGREAGFEVHKKEVQMPDGVLRAIGEYDITLRFHPEVSATVRVTVQSVAA